MKLKHLIQKKTTLGRNVENKKKQTKKGSKDKEYDTGNASQDTRYVKYDPRHLTHDTRPRLNKCDSEDTNHDPKTYYKQEYKQCKNTEQERDTARNMVHTKKTTHDTQAKNPQAIKKVK